MTRSRLTKRYVTGAVTAVLLTAVALSGGGSAFAAGSAAAAPSSSVGPYCPEHPDVPVGSPAWPVTYERSYIDDDGHRIDIYKVATPGWPVIYRYESVDCDA
ncbi:hypothetical protein [Plantactinospora sp. ZYX-F-223]|uniref:hypothetical protein n=1 Tax=Plantactinospora sp. ZYX-F-223 TaxID=3144103 RepID=UPI0031FBCBF7